MRFKLITHEKVVFDGDVDEIYSKGIDGEFGVLKNHIPMMTTLDVGITKVKKDDKITLFTTMGGVFQFKDDTAIILTEIAEESSDIDVIRAKSAKERAEARLADKSAKIDAQRAEAALARAKARLQAAISENKK